MSDEHWSNEKPLNIRTRLALKILMLMFKILSPYQFEHRFSKEIEGIEAEISGKVPETTE